MTSTCSFNDADMQLLTQGSWYTVITSMENRFPPSPGYIIGGR